MVCGALFLLCVWVCMRSSRNCGPNPFDSFVIHCTKSLSVWVYRHFGKLFLLQNCWKHATLFLSSPTKECIVFLQNAKRTIVGNQFLYTRYRFLLSSQCFPSPAINNAIFTKSCECSISSTNRRNTLRNIFL